MFVEKNSCKAAKGHILNKDLQIHDFKNGCNAIYHLFPLKSEYTLTIEDEDEYDEDIEKKEPDMIDYTKRSYEDLENEEINPRI